MCRSRIRTSVCPLSLCCGKLTLNALQAIEMADVELIAVIQDDDSRLARGVVSRTELSELVAYHRDRPRAPSRPVSQGRTPTTALRRVPVVVAPPRMPPLHTPSSGLLPHLFEQGGGGGGGVAPEPTLDAIAPGTATSVASTAAAAAAASGEPPRDTQVAAEHMAAVAAVTEGGWQPQQLPLLP